MLTPDVAATFPTREQLVNSRNDMASGNLWCLRLNAEKPWRHGRGDSLKTT
jgi:hypothetical protein